MNQFKHAKWWRSYLDKLWKSFWKLKFMKNQSFEVLCHKQIRNARRRSKEKSTMKHSWWQSCQLLLEHFLNYIFYILYTISKLRKSRIQCFKRWQFGVEMKELQPLQADHSKLKEEIFKVLRNHPFVAKWFRSLFVQCCGFPPEGARYMPQAGSWEP